MTVDDYLTALVARTVDALGPDLRSAWLGGSLVTGGFDAELSDVDVILVSGGALSDQQRDRLVAGLRHETFPCPAHGLDLIAWAAPELAALPRTPSYQFSLATGREWEDEISRGGAYAGGLLDLALVRDRGRTLRGESPEKVLPPVPEEWVLEELSDSLRWHRDKIHDPFHDPTGANAVLNACRTLHYLRQGRWASKVEGARWFRESVADRDLVSRALDGRTREGGKLARQEVVALLEEVLEAMINRRR